ncbi:MAG: PAS domain-containing sensor histidine kinase [Rhodothermales bacterium]
MDQPNFESHLNLLPVSVALLDAHNRVVRANRTLEKTLGVDPGSLEGQPVPLDSVVSEDQLAIRRTLADAHGNGRARCDFRYAATDGREASATLFARLINRDDGTLLVTVIDQTDLGVAESNMIQSERLYRSFLDQSPMGVLHLDAAGNVTFENNQFRRILGDDPRFSWIGLSVHGAPGMDRRLVPALASLVLEGTVFANRPATLVKPDDTVAEVVTFGSPIRRDGQIVGGVVMFQDRTQQVQQERELAIRDRFREAESRLRGAAVVGTEEDQFLSDAARILAVSIGASELVVLTYNPYDRSCRVGARWSQREGGSLSVEGRVTVDESPDDAAGVLHIDEHSLRGLLAAEDTDDILWVPFHGKTDLGGFVAFKLSDPSPVPVSREQLLGLLDNLIRTFETLWEGVQLSGKYSLAVSCIDDGLFTYLLGDDDARAYTFVTPQFQSLLGVSIQRILATDLPTTWFGAGLDAEGRTALVRHYAELRAERPSNVTYTYTQPNGKVGWLQETSTPHRNASGALVVSGMLRDITEQQAARQVLIKSKEEAVADARRKTSFLTTMSHELRTPLGTMNGFASMLKSELGELGSKGIVAADLIDFADAIEDRSRELLDFVDDLLDLSNLESGLLTLQHGVVDLHQVVAKSVEKIRGTLERDLIGLNVSIPAGLYLDGDSQRLERVVRKLVENAVKFTDPGGSIDIRASESNGTVTVEIVDTGVGIAPEHLERVANPFVQADDRLNRAYEGKGIGLTVAKRLVEAMDGTFEIKSELGRGTMVRLTFHAVRDGAGDSGNRAARRSSHSL